MMNKKQIKYFYIINKRSTIHKINIFIDGKQFIKSVILNKTVFFSTRIAIQTASSS